MLKKTLSKNKENCKVTFHLSADVNADSASLCGDFNDWDATAHPMTKNEDGSFSIALDLEPGQDYQFRYLLDGSRWENAWLADSYVPNDFGDENSVVSLSNAQDEATPS